MHPYTAERRGVLGNTSPENLEIFLGPHVGVQNPRPREISSSEGDAFPNTPLLSAVYGFIIITVASEYQGIYPYSAIDSVKINTSLMMIRECIIWKKNQKKNSCICTCVSGTWECHFWYPWTNLFSKILGVGLHFVIFCVFFVFMWINYVNVNVNGVG